MQLAEAVIVAVQSGVIAPEYSLQKPRVSSVALD
jgi:hypothetical protein